MTGRKGAPSTYDQMLAEIELDDEAGNAQAVVWVRKTPKARRAESKSSEKDRFPANPTSKSVDAIGTSDLSSGSKAGDAEDFDASRRRSSFPPAPRKTSSRRSSESHNSERDVKDGSDEGSGEEKEAHVRHKDEFGSPTLSAAVRGDHQLEANALRSFLTRAPKQGTPAIRCFMQRDRHGRNRLHPVFRFFLEDSKQFLLSAQKRNSNKTSNYLLTMDDTPTDRRSALVVAKLRANWSGSEYMIFDDGLSPSKTALDASVRSILGFVELAYDEMGPGRMNVRIPAVQESGASSQWRDNCTETDGSHRAAFDAGIDKSALLLRNKRPQYDAVSGGHVLDFKGRVTMPSIKNFQLQSDAHGDATVLQFGRVSCQPPGPHRQCKCHKETFALDVSHPLNPVQAFAICLATLDSKVADAKVFDSVAKLLNRMSS